jgi:hypothetical protein
MPIHRGSDSKGSFYQWGNSGKKYYYKSGNKKSREIAKSKAKKQAIAIYASGWKE